MASDPGEVAGERSQGLDERVLSTLQGLPGRIAFNGLRRVLRAHPESLSRSLRRLEREGLVDRAEGGYRAIGEVSTRVPPTTQEFRSIAQVDLPPGTISDVVLGRIAGRWFGSLRWVGVVDGPSGPRLAWARRDGSDYVLLGIQRGALRVYVRAGDPEDDERETEDAAYELLTHAVEALRPSSDRSVGSVSLLAAEPQFNGHVIDD